MRISTEAVCNGRALVPTQQMLSIVGRGQGRGDKGAQPVKEESIVRCRGEPRGTAGQGRAQGNVPGVQSGAEGEPRGIARREPEGTVRVQGTLSCCHFSQSLTLAADSPSCI